MVLFLKYVRRFSPSTKMALRKLRKNILLVKIKFGCGGHLGRRSQMPDIILEGDNPRIISAKFG
jgi:hypothetical protein